jgi:hypothetical protein
LQCNPSSSAEHSLASELASLLWRLRRASAIESELFQSQLKTMRQRGVDDNSIDCQTSERAKSPRHLEPPLIGQEKIDTESVHKCDDIGCLLNDAPDGNKFAKPSLAQSFLQLANFDNDAFDRLGRYETFLWRQAAQTIILLNSLKWRPEDARRRPSFRLRAARQRQHHFFPAHFCLQR